MNMTEPIQRKNSSTTLMDPTITQQRQNSMSDLESNVNPSSNNHDTEQEITENYKHPPWLSLDKIANISVPPATKPPKEALKAVYNAGKYKAGLALNVLFVQSVMAGIFIAMAGHVFLSVGGGILGASLFPTGLIAVILTSGELFTGDALIFVASVLGKRVSVRSLLRNWTVSWFGNFVGCVLWGIFIAWLSDALEDVQQDDFAVQLATKKAYQPWGSIFLKAIGANFMVCLGVWQATCAEEVAGKILALWFPITGFVIMGLDHCIANQFLISVGMMLGADISVTRFLFLALLPATLGNIVGGGFFVGAVYWFVFDSMDASRRLQQRMQPGWNHRTRHRTAGTPSAVTSVGTPAESEHREEIEV